MTHFDCLIKDYKLNINYISLHNYIQNLLDFWIQISFVGYVEISNKNRSFSLLINSRSGQEFVSNVYKVFYKIDRLEINEVFRDYCLRVIK